MADAPNLGADFQLYTMGSDLYRLMPQIRSITVRGFRNLKSFSWQPAAGVNVLLGAGDTGKSNVLHAVSLFARNRALTEFDYFSRDVASGFSIDLVITGLALGDLASERSTLPIRGWNSSELTSLPQGGAVPALVFRAQGTSDLELEYKLVAESGEVYFLSAALRQQLNLIFLSRADDNLNNFRAQQGSLLSRNFTDVDFRSSALAVMQQAITTWSDPVEAKQTLSDLRSEFQTLGLPGDLLLGIIPPSGAAASKSVAVFQGKSVSESIPFELSGDGTRNLSVLVLASRLLSTTPILLADEVESGLEPLRQRVAAKLVSRIQSNQGQAIVVTHAPAVVETLAEASQWIMASAAPIRIPPRLNASVFRNQPEAAFAHLSMVCEGATEMGLVPPFWNHFIGSDLEENGVCLVDAGGHTVALEMLEDLLKAGMPCAGFVDNEVEKRGTRDTIGKQCPLFTWAPLQMPEEAIAQWVEFDRLETLLDVILEARSKFSARYAKDLLIAQISKNIPNAGKRSTLAELATEHGKDKVRDAIFVTLSKNNLIKLAAVSRTVAEWFVENGIPAEMNNALKPFFDRFDKRKK